MEINPKPCAHGEENDSLVAAKVESILRRHRGFRGDNRVAVGRWSESTMAVEKVVTSSQADSRRRSRLLVQLGRIAVFARTPTPAVANAAGLALTPLSEILEKKILEKKISPLLAALSQSQKNQPALSTSNQRPPVGTQAFVARSSQLESEDITLRSVRVLDLVVSWYHLNAVSLYHLLGRRKELMFLWRELAKVRQGVCLCNHGVCQCQQLV